MSNAISETGTDNFIVAAADLEDYFVNLFTAFGATSETGREVARHLVEANLTGHDSHGALRAPWYVEKIELGELNPTAVPEIVKETPTTAVIDGGWGFGQPASRRAMEVAIQKAEAMGVACVAVRNANHMGRVGYYTQMASAAGMIGLGCVNLHGASPCVAPFGGIDRRLPTNPFSIAFPTDRETNFLADMTTSVVAEGKVQMRRNQGKRTEENWIIDHQGRATTDPWDFYNEPVGALLPMGGVVAHKGFALSMAIEGLAGGLSGAGCSNPEQTRHGNACWYTVIKIDAFTTVAQFKDDVGKLIDHVKSSRKAEGISEILFPGQPEYRRRQDRLKDGIPVDPQTWKWLGEKAEKAKVTPPAFRR